MEPGTARMTKVQRRERALAVLLELAQDAAGSGDDRDALHIDHMRRILLAAWAPLDWQGVCPTPTGMALEPCAVEAKPHAAAAQGSGRRREPKDVLLGKSH